MLTTLCGCSVTMDHGIDYADTKDQQVAEYGAEASVSMRVRDSSSSTGARSTWHCSTILQQQVSAGLAGVLARRQSHRLGVQRAVRGASPSLGAEHIDAAFPPLCTLMHSAQAPTPLLPCHDLPLPTIPSHALPIACHTHPIVCQADFYNNGGGNAIKEVGIMGCEEGLVWSLRWLCV